MTKPSFADLRAECARLGITPGRSIAETQRRLDEARAAPPGGQAKAWAAHGAILATIEARRQRPHMSRLMRELADGTALSGSLLRNRRVYVGEPEFQRIMDKVWPRVCGAEALARWRATPAGAAKIVAVH